MRGMYDKLPHFVNIKHERFIINTDFRIFIDFEYEMQEIDQNEAVKNVLNRFYPAFSLIVEKGYLLEAVDKFIWFYHCGKEEIPSQNIKKGKPEKNVFSYEYDDLYIWGTFKQYFNVDLTTDKIHWWKFKAMWLTIPRNAEFNRIKGYRAYDGKDQNMLDLKEYYKLPMTQKEIKDKIRRDKIFESLK